MNRFTPRLIGALAALGLFVSCNKSANISGIETFQVTRNHREGAIAYTMVPPVGGDHNPVVQNCGIYDTQVSTENAVHSLEHGAVWIAYQPDLPSGDVEALRTIARQQPKVLLAPYQYGALDSPLAVVAWGVRLKLKTVNDPRLKQFIQKYVDGPQSPEPGETCSGGVGSPIG